MRTVYLCSLFLGLAGLLLGAGDPFAGTWKFNVAKSKPAPTQAGMAIKEQTTVIEETTTRRLSLSKAHGKTAPRFRRNIQFFATAGQSRIPRVVPLQACLWQVRESTTGLWISLRRGTAKRFRPSTLPSVRMARRCGLQRMALTPRASRCTARLCSRSSNTRGVGKRGTWALPCYSQHSIKKGVRTR